jgi:hypothetical protein
MHGRDVSVEGNLVGLVFSGMAFGRMGLAPGMALDKHSISRGPPGDIRALALTNAVNMLVLCRNRRREMISLKL